MFSCFVLFYTIVFNINIIWKLKVVLSDPEKLEAIRQREADITKEQIGKIIASGANVVLTSQVCIIRKM